MMRQSLDARVAFFALIVSCTPASGPDQPSQPPTRFVAFRSPRMLVDRLEAPTEPPYAVGSAHAPEMLVSSDPSVVDVDPSGKLVAHRNGRASIRAAGGAVLDVTVLAVRSLRIIPPRLDVEPGTRHALEVTSEDGQPVPTDSIRWQTTDPNIAMALGPAVRAGMTEGTASLTASFGEARGNLSVMVRKRPKSDSTR